MKDIIRMQQLAGIITEGQAKKMMKILNESEAKDVTNPDDLSKTKAYDSLEIAKTELKNLETSTSTPEDKKKIANLIYNTAAHEVHKLREKYKTDKPLTDFEKRSLNRQFNWDDEKVMRDPINRTAQELMKNAEKYIKIDDKKDIEKY